MWRDSLSNLELEFLAESTLIYIVPNFRRDSIQLISGTYGPFKPNKAVQLPLWLAVNFRKNKKCKIIIPPYLDTNFLNNKVQEEKDSKGVLIQLPNYFFEIAQILFSEAEEDFFNIKETRGMVEDIAVMRMEKINQMIEEIKNDELTYKLEAFNEREIEQIRPFLNTIFPMKLNYFNPYHRNPNENILFANPSISGNSDNEGEINFSSGF